MDTNTIIIVGLIVAGFGALFYFVNQKFTELAKPKEDDKSLLLLNQNMQGLQDKLENTKDHLNSQLEKVNQVLNDVKVSNSRLTDFSKQLVGLENILRNPKHRGVFGEYLLENLLSNVFPPEIYESQFALGKDSDGREIKVDFIMHVNKVIIPIDSKFSMENYNKFIGEENKQQKEEFLKLLKGDLKKRIDETAKYIKPNLGTTDFAFMYIPSEAIYYDLLVNKTGSLDTLSLIDYAYIEKKVIIVSPTTFLAYLQTVLQGLNSLKVEKSIEVVVSNVKTLRKHLNSFTDKQVKVGRSLVTLVNSVNESAGEYRKIDKDITKIAGKGIGSEEIVLIDKPYSEDE